VPRSAVELGGCDLADGGAAVWFPPGTFAAQPRSALRELPGALAAFGLRLGFVVTDEVRLGPDAPPEWLMWRAPAS
jgi:hypothetical protein